MLGFSPVAAAPLAAGGSLNLFASLAVTEAQDTTSFAVNLTATTSLDATEAQDAASFAALIVATAALAATEDQDTASGDTFAITIAALDATEAQDVAEFDATLGGNVCVLDVTEAPDTAEASVSVVSNVVLAATEAPDTVNSIVYVLWANIPETAVTWTPQADGYAFWNAVDPPPTPSNSNRISILLSAPLGGAVLGASSVPPTGTPVGVQWNAVSSTTQNWTPVAENTEIWTPVPTEYNPHAEAA